MAQVIWIGKVPATDDFGDTITFEFIDGRVRNRTCWAYMTPKSWAQYGCKVLGQGYGQRYKKEIDDSWVKVEG